MEFIQSIGLEVLLLAYGVLFVGALLHGSIGYGLNLTSAPILYMVNPELVPGPLLLVLLTLTSLIALRERKHVDYHFLALGLAGVLPGIVAGTFLIVVLSQEFTSVALGALVLLAVVLSATGRHPPSTRPIIASAGMLSGLMATITSIAGPPMALVMQNLSGERVRGTLSCFLVVNLVLSLSSLSLAGKFGLYEIELGLVLLPAVIVGFVFSKYTRGYVDRGYTRPAILSVAGLAAASVVVRTIFF